MVHKIKGIVVYQRTKIVLRKIIQKMVYTATYRDGFFLRTPFPDYERVKYNAQLEFEKNNYHRIRSFFSGIENSDRIESIFVDFIVNC